MPGVTHGPCGRQVHRRASEYDHGRASWPAICLPSGDAQEGESADQRSTQRCRAYERGRINAELLPSTDCLIRNLSDTGVGKMNTEQSRRIVFLESLTARMTLLKFATK